MKKYLLLISLVGLISLPTLAHAEIDLRAVLEQLARRLNSSPLIVSDLSLFPNLPPKINSLSGPKNLKVGENGLIAYTFSWGDSVYVEKTKPARLEGQDEQLITFNHTYKQAGTYTITASATDDTNQVSQTSVVVKVE